MPKSGSGIYQRKRRSKWLSRGDGGYRRKRHQRQRVTISGESWRRQYQRRKSAQNGGLGAFSVTAGQRRKSYQRLRSPKRWRWLVAASRIIGGAARLARRRSLAVSRHRLGWRQRACGGSWRCHRSAAHRRHRSAKASLVSAAA
jgi:hypothetical protein